MEISVTIENRTLIVSLCGELDHHSASRIRQMTEEMIKNKGAKNVIFDFSRLTFMDSSGIGMVVGRFKLVSSLGGRMAIVGAPPTVDRLLSMSGIKKIIAVLPGREQAMQFFQEETAS